MLAALGSTSVPVHGSHTWLLSDPQAFGEIMTTIIGLHLADSAGAKRGKPPAA